jgi:hypothetical protein
MITDRKYVLNPLFNDILIFIDPTFLLFEVKITEPISLDAIPPEQYFFIDFIFLIFL